MLTEELEEKFKLELEEKEKQVRDEMHKKVGRSFVSLHGVCYTAFSVKKNVLHFTLTVALFGPMHSSMARLQ